MKLHIIAACVAAAFAAAASAHTMATTGITTAIDTEVAQVEGNQGQDLDGNHAARANPTGGSRGQSQVAARIAADFTGLAGSNDNALALVNGLRNATPVTLTTSTTANGTTTTSTTMFQPPTGRMGFGNVFNSLALAQSELTRAGIVNPTADQLQAALLGGTVTASGGTSTSLQGVLQLRAQGLGFGRIAQMTGTRLGPVVSGVHSARANATTASTGMTSASSRGMTTASGSVSTTAAASMHRPGAGVMTAANETVGASVAHGNGANGRGRGKGGG